MYETPVREICQARICDANVGGSRDTQSPLAGMHDLESVCKTTVANNKLFFLTGAIVVDFQRVDMNLGLEEGSGIRAGGERNGVVAGAVAVHGWAVGGRVASGETKVESATSGHRWRKMDIVTEGEGERERRDLKGRERQRGQCFTLPIFLS